jgi:hypothetical protein
MASKSDDMAYLQGTYTMTDPKTKKPMTDKGKYLTVFTKQPDGSWKAIADAFNSDPPILLTFKMFSVCKDFFMASMRPRLLVELSQA